MIFRSGRRVVTVAVVIAGVTTLSACGSMRSVQSDGNFDKRVYAGAGLLASQLEPDTSGVDGTDVDESGSGGAGLLLGFDMSDRFSIEGHVADLGESGLSPAGSIAYQVAGISGLVYGFNTEQDRSQRRGLSAYGRLGLGALNNDAEVVMFEKVNDVHLLAGAGLEYGFNNGVAARVEFVAHETDAKYAQLAVLYRFGGNNNRLPSGSRVAPVSPVAPEIDEVVEDVAEVEVTPLPLPETVVIETPEPDVQLPIEEADPVPPTDPLDVDLDGVRDDVDACLGTGPGLPVDDSGCEVFDGAIEGLNFLVGSADLTDSAQTVLAEVVTVLQNYPDIKVTIEAHTDNRGDAEQNLQLSKRRALSVARFLVERGISGLRLKPQAFGESEPRSTNATPEGRAENRRVEFAVFE